MSELSFQLQRFDDGLAFPSLAITGELRREGADLSVRFLLRGDLAELVIAPSAARPERRDGLWQTTCLEVFLAAAGQESYWEFNLSPGGDWNVYRLEGYRRTLKPEAAFTSFPFEVSRREGSLELTLNCTLPRPLAAPVQLEAAICAVIELRSGPIGYWALAHPGAEPDFHRREVFRLLTSPPSSPIPG
ncbi:DOMON-like domain-containing protein [Cyanobium sp. Morenito 9A2]|uniref:DOMON-like domain-containing protein n=1 Tax=Cyanobium sp. Morenito 9A2 TaxID=2823718 RepID=UPI0020CD804C|nr:DOMON-like domain-containing protein [Cyanobium sp. Morenito 9A2]MCP9850743.1 DOMON-like domain-containing protein [Cyanobium sp. Morenito 9A2]